MTISSQSLTSTLSYSIQLLSLILFIFSWSSCCWHSFFISLGLRLKCLLIGENFLYSFFGWRTAFSLQLFLLLVTPTPGTTGEVVPSLTAPKAYMESLPHFFFGFRSEAPPHPVSWFIYWPFSQRFWSTSNQLVEPSNISIFLFLQMLLPPSYFFWLVEKSMRLP